MADLAAPLLRAGKVRRRSGVVAAVAAGHALLLLAGCTTTGTDPTPTGSPSSPTGDGLEPTGVYFTLDTRTGFRLAR